MADNIYKQISRKLVKELEEPLREKWVARNVIFVDRRYRGMGITNIQTPEYDDMADAVTSYNLPTGNIARDKIATEVGETKVVSHYEPFEIPRDEYEAYRENGTMIDTAYAMSAMEKIAEKENEFVLQGWKRDGTNYEIDGLYNSGTTTATTSYDFATYGYALKKVAEAKAALKTAGVQEMAYNLLINEAQYAELDASVSANGIREFDQVLSALNPGRGTTGNIYQTSDMSENYGLLLPSDPRGKYFRLYETVAPRISFGEDSVVGADLSPIYGTAIERVAIRVGKPAAICKLSGI